MKSGKLLAALVLFAVAVGAVFLAREYRLDRTIAEIVEKIAFKEEGGEGRTHFIHPDEIVEIKFRNPQGSVTLEKNEEDVWYIIEPVRVAADLNMAPSLALKLAGVQEEEAIEVNPKNLSKYNLENPDVVVQFRLKGTDKWYTLHFGRRSPTASLYYTYNPDNKRVFLTDYSLKFDFNGPYGAYTNKIIFEHNPRMGNRALFEFRDVTYEFTYQEKAIYWIMIKPTREKAHARQFPNMLGGMSRIEAIKLLIPEETPPDNGLDDPFAKITFSKTGEWVETLIVGNMVEGVARYAKKADSQQVYLISADFMEALKDGLGNIGIVKAIWFPKKGQKRIEFIYGDQSFALFRDSKEAPWKFVGFVDVTVDHGAIWNVIYKLHAVKNRGYTGDSVNDAAAQYGLDNPVMVVKMEFFNKRFAPLTIYYGGKDPSGKFLYTYNSEDPYILKVDAIIEDVFPKSPEALLKK